MKKFILIFQLISIGLSSSMISQGFYLDNSSMFTLWLLILLVNSIGATFNIINIIDNMIEDNRRFYKWNLKLEIH